MIVMLKYPRPGRVKTRLAGTLGECPTAELYRCFVEDMLRTVDAQGVRSMLSVDPGEMQAEFASWLGTKRWLQPQCGADLGARMDDAFERAFAKGHERVVLIGSDLPDLPGQILQAAFGFLADHDVVIGPATDGGFYLLGWSCAAFRPGLLAAVPWGTPGVFVAARQALLQSAHVPYCLTTWSDVDDAAGLQDLLQRDLLPNDSATRTWVRNHQCRAGKLMRTLLT